ncbi:hypothetical protein SAY86_003077 [Trapa natans]|uniref:Uncharacterized protein n=1 Tax=Trapa natans TaxID=22666 RepID=A0AAN7LE97_TRANT|nr:hypothetical protein SAY86_003077 [Trapa natans]
MATGAADGFLRCGCMSSFDCVIERLRSPRKEERRWEWEEPGRVVPDPEDVERGEPRANGGSPDVAGDISGGGSDADKRTDEEAGLVLLFP